MFKKQGAVGMQENTNDEKTVLSSGRRRGKNKLHSRQRKASRRSRRESPGQRRDLEQLTGHSGKSSSVEMAGPAFGAPIDVANPEMDTSEEENWPEGDDDEYEDEDGIEDEMRDEIKTISYQICQVISTLIISISCILAFYGVLPRRRPTTDGALGNDLYSLLAWTFWYGPVLLISIISAIKLFRTANMVALQPELQEPAPPEESGLLRDRTRG
ncbi:hypothetical protein V5799_010871 [Amblyomma americanum]|uniref:Uncharacterized protein n=1 Tax=Amblyomma americanum TaxID=6943 RepID=A0AAQ4EIU2_AMBAM